MDVDASMTAREARVIRAAKAVGDPTRLRLLRAIAARDEVSCQELTERFALAQGTISHHLKVLTDAGLVAVRRGGPFHYFRLVPGALAAHGAALDALVRPRSTRRHSGRPHRSMSMKGARPI